MSRHEGEVVKITQPNNGGLATFKKDNKWYLVDVTFNDDTFDLGEVKILEENTSQYEIQDRFKVIAAQRNFG